MKSASAPLMGMIRQLKGMGECAICGRETDQLHTCSECRKLVCGLCYVKAIDMCRDCEETWEAEEDLDFL